MAYFERGGGVRRSVLAEGGVRKGKKRTKSLARAAESEKQ